MGSAHVLLYLLYIHAAYIVLNKLRLFRKLSEQADGFNARRLSVDHTAEDPAEQTRCSAVFIFLFICRYFAVLCVTCS